MSVITTIVFSLVIFGNCVLPYGASIPERFTYRTRGFGKTYYGNFIGTSFRGAVNQCLSVGGVILKIESAEEQAFFVGLDQGFWLNARDKRTWHDGTRMKYDRWGFHNRELDDLCAFIGTGGAWHGKGCLSDSPVICEVVDSVTPSPPTESSLDLKDMLFRHHNYTSARESSNNRLKNIERRLEQISNVVINHGAKSNNVNMSAINESLQRLQNEQSSLKESFEDMKRLMQAIFKSIHGQE